MFQIEVSASVLDVVDLTPQQTLALYGNTIPARCFANGVWTDCNFTYFGKSSDMVSGYKTYVTQSSFLDSDPDYAEKMFEDSVYLFYRCPVSSLSSQPDIEASMMFDLHFSVDLQGIAYFRQIFGCGVSSAAYDSNARRPVNGGTSFSMSSSVSYSPLAPVVTAGKNTTTANGVTYVRSIFSTIVSHTNNFAQDIVVHNESKFAFGDIYLENLVDGLQQTFSLSSQQFYCSKMVTSILPDDVLNPTNNPADYTTYYVICLMCPRVTEGYIFPDDPGGETPPIGDLVHDINVNISGTNTLLQQILAKLDLIYNKMDIDISGTVNISSTSIGGLLDGIHNLFVPTQSQLVTFRLNLMSELHSAFPAFFTAEDSIHDAYTVFHDVSAVSSVRFPGVSVSFPSGSESDSVLFSIPAQDVELKPEPQRFAPLYDALALIVDIVCTLSVFNMVKHRFHKDFEGSVAD